MQDIEIIDFF